MFTDTFAINLFSNERGQLCMVGHNLGRPTNANRRQPVVKSEEPRFWSQKEFREYNSPGIFAARAEAAMSSANALDTEIYDTEQTLEAVRYRLKKLESTSVLCSFIMRILGFAFGLWLGSAEILHFHGPTVTTIGTIIGFLFTLALCVGFSRGLSWMTTQEFEEHIKKRKEIAENLEQHIILLQEEQEKNYAYAKHSYKRVFN